MWIIYNLHINHDIMCYCVSSLTHRNYKNNWLEVAQFAKHNNRGSFAQCIRIYVNIEERLFDDATDILLNLEFWKIR